MLILKSVSQRVDDDFAFGEELQVFSGINSVIAAQQFGSLGSC